MDCICHLYQENELVVNIVVDQNVEDLLLVDLRDKENCLLRLKKVSIMEEMVMEVEMKMEVKMEMVVEMEMEEVEEEGKRDP